MTMSGEAWRRRRRLRRRVTFRAGLALAGSIAWLADLAGPRALRATGHALGDLHYLFGIRKRRDLQRQLVRVLDEAGPGRVVRWLREAYRVNDRGVLELMVMATRGVDQARVRRECDVDGIDVLRDALAGGHGAILIGMHSCNGVYMTGRIAAEGIPVTLVYRESNKMPDGLFARALGPLGVDGIEASDRARAYRAMLRALREQRVLCVMMDQASKRGGLPVDFLGKRLTLPAGPPELIRRSGAPVLFARPLPPDARWQFRVEALDGVARDADAQTIAERLAEVIVGQIRRYPQLWTWHHRRWRRYPFADAATGD